MVDAKKWGMKRTCQNCGCKFYDLNKDPIVCPKCETEFNLEATTRPKRGRKPLTAAQKKEKLKAVLGEPSEDVIEGLEDIEVEEVAGDDTVPDVPDVDEDEEEDLSDVVKPIGDDE